MSHSSKDVAAVIAKLLDRSSDPAKAAKQIAAYLVDSKSVKVAGSLLRRVEAVRQKDGVVEAVISSAHPVENGQRSQIERIIHKHLPNATKIILVDRIDPTLIGGVRVHVAGKEFDVTVRDKLNRLKHVG